MGRWHLVGGGAGSSPPVVGSWMEDVVHGYCIRKEAVVRRMADTFRLGGVHDYEASAMTRLRRFLYPRQTRGDNGGSSLCMLYRLIDQKRDRLTSPSQRQIPRDKGDIGERI